MKVGFISLGCSKNLIDTEVAIGHFKNNNYEIETNPEKAEIIVINTCGFIESAKEEAINTILEMAEYKKKNCKYLIAMGCLVQRYYDDLVKELPEVDLFIKIDEYPQMWQKIEKLIKENIVEESTTKTNTKISEMKPLPMPTYNEFYERVITTGKNFAYLKIGEGCSNRCTYCAIPYIRGPFVSRRIEEIMEEARMLAGKGIRELIVIAQDTTKYGEDLYGEPKLAELLQQLSAIPEIKWIRFLYSYPEGISDELIEIVKNNEKIQKLIDRKPNYIVNNEKNEKVEIKEENKVEDHMQVNQGKIVIGLTVNSNEEGSKFTTSVYNAILGGGANSKLFQNVREKASLAYTASSSYVRQKNSIFIRCGIEIENYEKALNTIKEQLEDMKNGNFTQEDIQNAKNLIVESVKSISAEQDTQISYYYGQELSDKFTTIDEYAKKIEEQTKEQVVELAKNIEINTIYFLRD